MIPAATTAATTRKTIRNSSKKGCRRVDSLLSFRKEYQDGHDKRINVILHKNFSEFKTLGNFQHFSFRKATFGVRTSLRCHQ
jgi:hypothetical protein